MGRVEADIGVLPAEQLDAVGKAGEQEDPADPVLRHAPSDERPHGGERQREDQERDAAEPREDVARQDAAGTDRQQDERRNRDHDAQAQMSTAARRAVT